MGHTSRLGLLSEALEARGMAAAAARELSYHLVLRHPLVERVGVPGLAGAIGAAGVPPDRARHTALMLLGLEWLDRGAHFGRLRDELARAASGGEALAAAIEAAGLHREIRTVAAETARRRSEKAAHPLLVRAAALAIALAGVAGIAARLAGS